MKNKIFISHSSEDKDLVARPLAYLLKSEGIEVWYDEFELKMGDSLISTIDKGLEMCDYAVVILSPGFFSKNWTKRELTGLATKELHSGNKVILPILHNISIEEVSQFSLPLGDRYAIHSSKGIESICIAIKNAIGHKNADEKDSKTENSVIHYKSSHIRYTLIKPDGSLAIGRKTNWLYTKESNILTLKDGGMTSDGKYEKLTSNLGNVEIKKEGGGMHVAYTHLSHPLVPDKLSEHYLEYEILDSYTESKQLNGITIASQVENVGIHILFPKERKVKCAAGSVTDYNSNSENPVTPFISSDSLYLSLVVNYPLINSHLKLEWEW